MAQIKLQELIHKQALNKQSTRRQFSSVAGFAQLLGDFAKNKKVLFRKYRKIGADEDKIRPPNRWVKTVLDHPEVFSMKKYIIYRKSLMNPSRETSTDLPTVDHLAQKSQRVTALEMKDRANSVVCSDDRG